MEELKQRSMHRVLSEVRELAAEKGEVDWTPIHHEDEQKFLCIEHPDEHRIIFHIVTPLRENKQYQSLTVSKNPGSTRASVIEGRLFSKQVNPLSIREDIYDDMPQRRDAEIDDLMSLSLLLEKIEPKSTLQRARDRVRNYIRDNTLIGRLTRN